MTNPPAGMTIISGQCPQSLKAEPGVSSRASAEPDDMAVNKNIASRQAWLDFADEPIDTLVPSRSESVLALEWLLGEDALREV